MKASPFPRKRGEVKNSRRHAVAQRGQEFFAVDAMLAAGVFHRVEGCDRTADTGHPEGEKHADRVRRRPHDVIDQIVGSEGMDNSIPKRR